MDRLQQISDWLNQQWPGEAFRICPASADASFRRYFRVTRVDGSTRIVMDAPPEQEDCRPWLAVRHTLAAAGVKVPEVFAEDLQRGFLLISDLGDTLYLDVLNPGNAAGLYADALGTLIRIQTACSPVGLPAYDGAFLQRELALFPEWYLCRHLEFELSKLESDGLARAFAQLVACNLGEAQTFVHRDFHSRNLMLRPSGADGANPGVIDFQGALHGPLSYDLASLLKDAYVDWDEEFVIDLLARYWDLARKAGLPVKPDFSEFYRDFEWMAVQRHLKILGIFARLHHRDGKVGYLKDMPRVAQYVRKACSRYGALTPILRVLDRAEDRKVQAGYTF